MTKLLWGLLALLYSFAAYAQAAPADSQMAPMDTATMMGVVAFLVLFFGTIVAYFVWVWWTHRGQAQPKED